MHLAKMLSNEKHDIVLMDPDEDKLAFTRAGMEIMPFAGNPVSLNDLEEAGVARMDLFISVTTEETTNITACMLAAKMGAAKTLARINNYEYLLPKNQEFFRNAGINSMIYPEMLAAKEIVSALKLPWTRQSWELANGSILLTGVKVRDNAPIVNKYLTDLAVGRQQTLSYSRHKARQRDHHTARFRQHSYRRHRFLYRFEAECQCNTYAYRQDGHRGEESAYNGRRQDCYPRYSISA